VLLERQALREVKKICKERFRMIDNCRTVMYCVYRYKHMYTYTVYHLRKPRRIFT